MCKLFCDFQIYLPADWMCSLFNHIDVHLYKCFTCLDISQKCLNQEFNDAKSLRTFSIINYIHHCKNCKSQDQT